VLSTEHTLPYCIKLEFPITNMLVHFGVRPGLCYGVVLKNTAKNVHSTINVYMPIAWMGFSGIADVVYIIPRTKLESRKRCGLLGL
jgi:hypothetical protein